MPTIQDLVDQLEAEGVSIVGRDKILAAESNPRWTIELTDFVLTGRQHGVAISRGEDSKLTNQRLYQILLGYAFDEKQRILWVNNV